MGQLLPGPAAADAGGTLGDDIGPRVRGLGRALDQNPGPLPGGGQGKAAGELAALQPDRQMARFVAENLGRALNPDDHGAAAARLSLVHALEVARLQRVPPRLSRPAGVRPDQGKVPWERPTSAGPGRPGSGNRNAAASRHEPARQNRTPAPCDRTAGHSRPGLGPAWLRVPGGCPPGRSPSSAAAPDPAGAEPAGCSAAEARTVGMPRLAGLQMNRSPPVSRILGIGWTCSGLSTVPGAAT